MNASSFRIRSFVRRSRQKALALKTCQTLLPSSGLNISNGFINPAIFFGRSAPLFLEIGFGFGHSLLAAAKAHPEKDFIGVEVHQPGIAALLLGIEEHRLNNLRVYEGDVIDILEKCIRDVSSEGIQIFFPDPWPKRRHHRRRLIQAEFVKLLALKLKPNGTLHLATDAEDYARHMMKVLSEESALINLASENQFALRSVYRPIQTKFEKRAQQAGRFISELQFAKKAVDR